jgi:endonuclease YncB( thermonuclease family)
MSQEELMIIVPEHPGTDTIKVPVLKVTDGDGFLTRIRAYEVTGNPRDQEELAVTARFGFIDAPELGQQGGREAKDFLTALIGGQWVELVILTKMDTGQSVDRHGRVVCVPFLTLDYSAGEFRTSSKHLHMAKTFGAPLTVTRNIELEMVVNGWAWVLERYGPDERYLEALDEAKRHKRGIWTFENNIHPWEFKKQKYRETQRSATNDPSPKRLCPIDGCHGYLVRRNGRFGEFLGCSNFPRCKYCCSAVV